MIGKVQLTCVTNCRFWHWTTRARRQSIIDEGLRRCSFVAGKLRLYAAELEAAARLQEHVRQHHGWVRDNMEGWLLRTHESAVIRLESGIVVIEWDVPSCDLIGPFTRVIKNVPKTAVWGTVY